ncbi:protein of unknown function [Nitrospira japonica]|uniref:DUF1579 domain-containing protein n=1 Tax=Nitrospira japonica TaxID=1325564 RepID=A0A1W1IAB4_9BACT|nr:DUF1579 family protein [Nitrospira japonica]SLM49932.1 protein of unknown function [Nitrospira japonica]
MTTQAEMLMALHEFVGEWDVTQKIWSGPNATPSINRGKTKCTTLLGGAATLMITEMETSNFKGVALMTYNPKLGRYDMAFIDCISDEGIALMQGEHKPAAAADHLRAEFGKMATQAREWRMVGVGEGGEADGVDALAANVTSNAVPACLSGSVVKETALAENVSADDLAPTFRMVENKISDDHWVLDFFLGGTLVQQNSFVRAGH